MDKTSSMPVKLKKDEFNTYYACDTCSNLNITEAEQDRHNINAGHFCNKFKKRLRHYSLIEHKAIYKGNLRSEYVYRQKSGWSKHIKPCDECLGRIEEMG